MKLLMITLMAVAVAVAGAASAQTTTTDCNRIADTVYCNSHTAPPPAPRETGYNAAINSYNRLNEIDAAQTAERTRRQVGQLLAAGRCDDARATALRAGEIELAGQVDAACAR